MYHSKRRFRNAVYPLSKQAVDELIEAISFIGVGDAADAGRFIDHHELSINVDEPVR
jgi:hypothetical protein